MLARSWTFLLFEVFFFHDIHKKQRRSHPRRPRGSESGRVKTRDESFQAWAEEPLGTDCHRNISKRSRVCWLLIGHKKLNALYYCSQSANSFSWVLFVSSCTTALSRHSCPVRSPSFPNQKWRNYRWVKNRFGCFQWEQFNCTETILFLTDHNVS